MPGTAGCDAECGRAVAVMSYTESPVVFECDGDRLIGILAMPLKLQSEARECLHPCSKGVLILVGGPQYRAGSHRQFTLLARDLANQGITSLRFDYRGMGDSEGASRAFNTVDMDIAAAIDAFFQYVPTLGSVVIWGLCDAASAALMYAHKDLRVTGLILLNPWVHTEDAEARVRLKHYYLKRFIEPSFWFKLLSNEFNFYESFGGFFKSLHAEFFLKLKLKKSNLIDRNQSVDEFFISRMLLGIKSFRHEMLFILSENDLTAQEFILLVKKNKEWGRVYWKSSCFERVISDASHTFSSASLRRRVFLLTSQFVMGEIKL